MKRIVCALRASRLDAAIEDARVDSHETVEDVLPLRGLTEVSRETSSFIWLRGNEIGRRGNEDFQNLACQLVDVKSGLSHLTHLNSTTPATTRNRDPITVRQHFTPYVAMGRLATQLAALATDAENLPPSEKLPNVSFIDALLPRRCAELGSPRKERKVCLSRTFLSYNRQYRHA